MKKIVAILMAMIMVISVTVVLAGSAADNDTKTKEPVIIGFKSTPGPADKAMVRGHGGDIKYSYTIINAIAAKLPEPAIENIQKSPRVTYVEIDGEVHTLDAELDNSWGVKRIGAGTVHASGNNGTGVMVAILDTGIDYEHSDLDDNYIDGYDFVNDDSDPMDDNGHGTHCAGIVAAEDNGEGVVGVAPGADLYAVKVLNSVGSGSESDVIAGIQWSVDKDMDVISMSFGSNVESTPLKDACDNADSSGVLLVAAAGNDGNPPGRGDNVDYPAGYYSVIAVAATDSNDIRARWSSTGPAVELAAPGVNINSTYLGGEYAYASGTSMACPHVAGTAALIGGGRQYLRDTADDLGAPGKDDLYGHGLVDADEAAPPTANQPPVADANGPYAGDEGSSIEFDGSGSSDPDGTIGSYEWDFDDGATGTGETTTHAYSTAGTYKVTLTVTDDEGATGTDTAMVTVTETPNEPPVADANGQYTGIEGDEILFNGSGSFDPDGDTLTYAWDFGDGSTGTGVSPTYTYKANGTYTVALTVNDGEVDSAPSTTTATISDVDPVASFTSDSPKPEGEVMSFTDTSTSYDGILWSWEFGDGGTHSVQNPTHAYESVGTYTVNLTVTEADGDVDTTTAQVKVTSCQRLNIRLTGGLHLLTRQ
jgi:PKD repeat protein